MFILRNVSKSRMLQVIVMVTIFNFSFANTDTLNINHSGFTVADKNFLISIRSIDTNQTSICQIFQLEGDNKIQFSSRISISDNEIADASCNKDFLAVLSLNRKEVLLYLRQNNEFNQVNKLNIETNQRLSIYFNEIFIVDSFVNVIYYPRSLAEYDKNGIAFYCVRYNLNRINESLEMHTPVHYKIIGKNSCVFLKMNNSVIKHWAISNTYLYHTNICDGRINVYRFDPDSLTYLYQHQVFTPKEEILRSHEKIALKQKLSNSMKYYNQSDELMLNESNIYGLYSNGGYLSMVYRSDSVFLSDQTRSLKFYIDRKPLFHLVKDSIIRMRFYQIGNKGELNYLEQNTIPITHAPFSRQSILFYDPKNVYVKRLICINDEAFWSGKCLTLIEKLDIK